jgi:hypothetical protein
MSGEDLTSKLGQNFWQNFCNLMTKANIPNWGKFLSKILQNQTQTEHSKLGQLLKGNDSGFPKVAYHFNTPSGVLFPSKIIFYSGVLPQ